MNPLTLQKLLFSALSIGVISLVFHLLKAYARRTREKFSIRKSRYFAIRRILDIITLVLCVAALLVIWDITLKNIWFSVTSILAVTAIAFFAVWSLVGNILAGILIYFTSPFRIDDTIEVMPDEIRGTVLAVNTFYTVLLDDDDNYINIPNSLFFQKYIKVNKRRPKQLQNDIPSENMD